MPVETVEYPEDVGMVPFDREQLLEVKLNPETGGFLTVAETLTRIGMANRSKKTLWQSCHILQKKGRYYIVHFLELFALDGKRNYISTNDLLRRNTIAQMLEKWNLLEIISEDYEYVKAEDQPNFYVIPYSAKSEWELISKYSVGNPRNREAA